LEATDGLRYSARARIRYRSPQQPSQQPVSGFGNRCQPCGNSLHRGTGSGTAAFRLAGASHVHAPRARRLLAGSTDDAPHRFPTACLNGSPRSVHRLSANARQHGGTLHRRIFSRCFIACRRPASGFRSCSRRFAFHRSAFSRCIEIVFAPRPVAGDLLQRASILHRKPFDPLLRRISALHTSTSRTSLHRVDARFTRPSACCFIEQSLRCGSCTTRVAPAEAGSDAVSCNGPARYSATQEAGEPAVCARPRRAFPPGRSRSPPGEPAGSRCRRGRIVSAVPRVSGRARAALMQPRDSVASRNSAVGD
jgi:hypothetical protein